MSASTPFLDFSNTQSGSGGMLIPGIGSGSSAGVNMPGMPNSKAVNPFSMIPLTGQPGGGGGNNSTATGGDWLSKLFGMSSSFGGNTPGGLIPQTQTDPIGFNSTGGIGPNGQTSGTRSPLQKSLDDLVGSGLGNYLTQLLGSNYFSQIGNAYTNASLPTLARGTEGIMNEFGGMGERYSSAAAIGLGDYESQWALNQQQMLAQLLDQQIGRQFNLAENLIPGRAKKQNDPGFWTSLGENILSTIALGSGNGFSNSNF